MTQVLTQGAHHIGLTVPDLATARAFFCDALGFSVVGEVPDYPAVFVADGSVMLTLWRASDPAAAVPFDRKTNVGLHHLALSVADDAALMTAYERVRAHPGVEIECAPGPIAAGSRCRHFLFTMPGGVRLELATPLG